MSDIKSIPHGPQEFERLLVLAKLSERESQAIRSVALSMTAAEAAPIIGVSESTVGSYRQRAYAKLGVGGRAEFLRLPSVINWTSRTQEKRSDIIHSQNERKPDGDFSRDAAHIGQQPPSAEDAICTRKCHTPPEASLLESAPSGHDGKDVLVAKKYIILRNLSISLLVAISAILLMACFFACSSKEYAAKSQGIEYAAKSQGIIASQYGDVPNVVGMRADVAASEVANAGFCPEFKAYASSLSPGTVLSIEKIGDAEDLGTDIISFSWKGGSAGCYEEGGDWVGYVVLAVAV